MHNDSKHTQPFLETGNPCGVVARLRRHTNALIAWSQQAFEKDLRLSLIVLLGFFVGITIVPFTVYRFFNGQAFHAMVNLFIVTSILSLAFYAYVTGKSLIAGKILVGVICGAGSVTAVFLGWEGFVWLYPGIIATIFISTPAFGFRASMILVAVVFSTTSHFDSTIQAASSMATYVVTALIALIVAWRYSVEHQQLEHRAEHDALTGLKNRYSLEGVIESTIQQVKHSNIPASMLMLDIDHFKAVNDELGHQVGDQVLEEVADLINAGCRAQDSVCRYGGEEFVIILNNCVEKDAMAVAEKLRRRVEEQIHCERFPITVSVGVTQLRAEDKPRMTLERADQSMYVAKEQGRNRCYGWSDGVDERFVALAHQSS